MNPAPSYSPYGFPAVDARTVFRQFQCPTCLRLWVIVAAANPPHFENQDSYIYRNLLGTVHFADRSGTFNICTARPVEIDRPDVLAAYHLGGAAAVDAMGGRKNPACSGP